MAVELWLQPNACWQERLTRVMGGTFQGAHATDELIIYEQIRGEKGGCQKPTFRGKWVFSATKSSLEMPAQKTPADDITINHITNSTG